MEQVIHVGLLGLGTVGTGVVKVLERQQASILKRTGAQIQIDKILVRNPNKQRAIVTDKTEMVTEAGAILQDPQITVVIEVMGGIEPALSYIKEALHSGKHVVTANKDIIAQHGEELLSLAESNNVDLLFEASVAGGIPIIRPLKTCLTANTITEIMGIINGTTNFMLTKMTEENQDYQEVLAEAQRLGYAESDPTADVGGLDAARKLAILASIAFGSRVTFRDVAVEGITKISIDDIRYAKELGFIIKLLGIAKQRDNKIEARVHPVFLPQEHPLSAVGDVFNAIFVKGDAVGEAMFYGRGAGEMPTASAVCADLIQVVSDIQHHVTGKIQCTCFDKKELLPLEETVSPFYIRMVVQDKPGVLATIASAFGDQEVSMHSVIQKKIIDQEAEIVVITYENFYGRIHAALEKIAALDVVSDIKNVIRVEMEHLS